jgi:hypothetical protein
MEIFISWSGERSKKAAETLHAWLPKVINAVRPWLSASDVEKGARWATDVASRLEAAKVGIICLTPGNLHSDWILFEAGALSKTLQNTYVCPLLIGLKPPDVKGPLAQFQATRAVKDEILRLVKTINNALGDSALSETHVEEAYEVWWPRLEAQLNNLPSEDITQPERPDRDILEEILALVRSRERPQLSASPQPSATDIQRRRLAAAILDAAKAVGLDVDRVSFTGLRKDGLVNCVLGVKDGALLSLEVPVAITADELAPVIAEKLRSPGPKA